MHVTSKMTPTNVANVIDDIVADATHAREDDADNDDESENDAVVETLARFDAARGRTPA